MNVKNVLLIGILILFLPACVKQQPKKLSEVEVRKIENKLDQLENFYKKELALNKDNNAEFEYKIIKIVEFKPIELNFLQEFSGNGYSESHCKIVLYSNQLSSDIKLINSFSKKLFNYQDILNRANCLSCELKCLHKKVTSLRVYKKTRSKKAAMFVGSAIGPFLASIVFITSLPSIMFLACFMTLA